MNNDIDIVLLWVDGNDKEWQKKKELYDDRKDIDSRINRYRDCQNLQYVFRGIEKNASWFNKIFFITYGHVPEWLNIDNKRIVIVKHEEFIPKEYLPTFNSNVIELNLHRIEKLSEKFILLNDDFFLVNKTIPEDFFVNGKPTDVYAEKFLFPKDYNDIYYMMLINVLAIINKHFDKKEVYNNNLNKYINTEYKEFNKYTKYSMKLTDGFVGFEILHEPYAYLKSTFNEVWKKEKTNLNKCCKNKFRKSSDLGHVLCKFWQMAKGNFEPKGSYGKYLYYQNDNTNNINEMKSGKYKYICINDDLTDIDFEKSRDEINDVLQELFPKKSSFEL